jgi:hypothetical protein
MAESVKVEARTSGLKVFCVPAVPKQKLIGASFQPCMIDSDADGAFEGWFNAMSQTKSILMLTGNYPKKPKAIAATVLSRMARALMKCATRDMGGSLALPFIG